MTVMPGAVWRPIAIPGGNPGARTKGRGVVLHVAASEATSLFGFFNNNPNANSHFYVNKAGVIEQYVDTDLQAWASMAANKNTISVETQGGVTNPDAEPWTPAQVAALGRICAWAHATEGTPLTPMPNSLPTSKGIGYHRLGIDPWRVSGGEVWSSSRGKLCPGAAKIAQIPAVIAAALGGEVDMPLTQAEIQAVATAAADAVWTRQIKNPTRTTSAEVMLANADSYANTSVPAIRDAVAAAVGKPTVDVQGLAAAIVAALPAGQAAEVAQAVVDQLGQRISSPPAA